jgi:hypothetical protein
MLKQYDENRKFVPIVLYDPKVLNKKVLQNVLLLETKKLLEAIQNHLPHNALLEIRREL